jgi:hypothetical protein
MVDDRRATTDPPLAAEPSILTVGQVVQRGLRRRGFDDELARAVGAGEISEIAGWGR